MRISCVWLQYWCCYEQFSFLKSVLDRDIQTYGVSEDCKAAIENISLTTGDKTTPDGDGDLEDTDDECDELDENEYEPQGEVAKGVWAVDSQPWACGLVFLIPFSILNDYHPHI